MPAAPRPHTSGHRARPRAPRPWLAAGLLLGAAVLVVGSLQAQTSLPDLPAAAKTGMGYFAHLVVGIAVAFVASLPLGPVNLSVIQASINHGRPSALAIAVGSSLVELFYCLVAVGGVELIIDDTRTVQIIQIISVPVLLGIGLYNLLKRMPVRPADETLATKKPRSLRTSFLLGVSLNFLNPLLLPFWMAATAWLRGHRLLTADTTHLVLFSGGVAVGTFLLLMTMSYVGARYRGIMSHHTQKVINRVIGALFLCSALAVTYLLLRGSGAL